MVGCTEALKSYRLGCLSDADLTDCTVKHNVYCSSSGQMEVHKSSSSAVAKCASRCACHQWIQIAYKPETVIGGGLKNKTKRCQNATALQATPKPLTNTTPSNGAGALPWVHVPSEPPPIWRPDYEKNMTDSQYSSQKSHDRQYRCSQYWTCLPPSIPHADWFRLFSQKAKMTAKPRAGYELQCPSAAAGLSAKLLKRECIGYMEMQCDTTGNAIISGGLAAARLKADDCFGACRCMAPSAAQSGHSSAAVQTIKYHWDGWVDWFKQSGPLQYTQPLGRLDKRPVLGFMASSPLSEAQKEARSVAVQPWALWCSGSVQLIGECEHVYSTKCEANGSISAVENGSRGCFRNCSCRNGTHANGPWTNEAEWVRGPGGRLVTG